MRSNVDFKGHQSCIYLIDKDVFNYIQILASLPQVVALYQVQNGQPRLIAYASKRMPEAAKIIPSQSWKCVDWQ